MSLEVVPIGVIDGEAEEHGAVIPGYRVLSVYSARGKDDYNDSKEVFFFTRSRSRCSIFRKPDLIWRTSLC